MKASRQHDASSMWRSLVAALIGVLCLVLLNETALSDSADLSQEIADMRTAIDQLNKEIETLKKEAAAVEQKWEKIASERPPSFHTQAAAIRISQLTAAWVNRPSFSGSGYEGVAPIITFNLKNVGTTSITDINLLVSFYKPDKEVIGGGMIGVLDSTNAPWRPGMWQKVTIDHHLLQFPVTRSMIALNADLYVETEMGSYALIGNYKISPRLEH
jgi:hypothetical protein